MCGILALRSPDRRHAPGTVAAGLGAMRHRGPDGSGSWISPDGRTALGHARLALVDRAGGGQPFGSEDGAVVAVVNGELYDHDRLRARLEAEGHRFRSRSDSEIVVHLYEQHGLALFPYLRGEFAFVLWDSRERRLVAARDRFGIKPLCFSVARGARSIASEAKALFACGVPRAWDGPSLYAALSMQYLPPSATPFAGVRQLEPGQFLVEEQGAVRLARYWDLDFPPDGEHVEGSDAELAAAVGERLAEAVRLRLHAEAPVGCYLSGGVDSSAIVALAARHLPPPLACFTVGFASGPYDEQATARATAAAAGARHHVVGVSGEEMFDRFADAVHAAEGLAINGHLPAKYLLSRAVRDAGVRVILSGEGADEAFAGYPHLRADVSGREPADAMARGIMLPAGPALPLDGVRARLGFVPRFLAAKATLGHRVHGVLAPDFARAHAGRDVYREFVDALPVEGQLAGRAEMDQSLYLWCKSALATSILRTLGDGTEMAHSVEGRLPFLGHHLFALARSIPPAQRVRGDREKHVLREAVAPLVTAEVSARRKQPFYAPPFGLDDRLVARARETLSASSFRALPFFDPSRVSAFLDELPRRPAEERVADDPVLMLMLSVAALTERFGLGTEVPG